MSRFKLKTNALHISFHIEKTAGTTLLSVLNTIYSDKNVLEYNTRLKRLVYSSNIVTSRTNPMLNLIYSSVSGTPFINLAYKVYSGVITNKYINRGKLLDFDQIPESIKAIHGHFYPSNITMITRPTFKTIVFRDPLQRMLSQYKHWKRIQGFTSWRFPVTYDPNITFEQYALLPTLRNYQTKTLQNVKLDYFDLIGISNNLSDFISKIYEANNLEPTQVDPLKLNSSPETKYTGTDRFEKQFQAFHSQDYELYEKAKKLANK